MFVCFESNNFSLEKKFSNLKRKLCISAPVVLCRAVFLRKPKADSTASLEGHSGVTSFTLSSSQSLSSTSDSTWCVHPLFVLTNKTLSFKNTYMIEKGLSDFHKMIVAVMKMHFPKMKPQVVSYRKYKDFHNETFLDSLRHELNVQGQFLNEKGPDAFSAIYTEILDNHAPNKKRYMRYNHKPFINNKISKTIMVRSRLKNRFLKNRSEENRKLFCKQRNKYV